MKTKTSQDETLLALAEPIAQELGMEIVRVRVQGGKRQIAQIMAERHDGQMNVEDCARLSRAMNAVLEDVDPIKSEYVLEVSSPGIDRPLTTLAHFARWEGFHAKIELDRLVEGRKRFRGELAGIEEDAVLINIENEDETAVLPFAWIADAKLILTDALMDASLKASSSSAAEAAQSETIPDTDDEQ
ncbi:ribosome maturation factor RimP [Marinicauda pacifica]|uniref:Ribosome maturation factor RimP n=1 Tax=Marinicauda pacifica TaxID=1133559 RepID=A0A4S2HAR4_9PROT|nr:MULTISPECIES: ribosome maturation factor RimP [Marinicauda]TGY92522.1 ribosome maturation factor RimP [Marinicauda pacifica]GGE49609.1 ribosome maturation factor RimP [Marinicauda pacifica]